jgi:sRNA-binding protein
VNVVKNNLLENGQLGAFYNEVMTKKATEGRKGWRDARQVIPLLQERWPLAFPGKSHLVKPLASSVPRVISETMGWDLYYTRGVLSVWKRRNAYCEAIQRGGPRIDIDGKATPEPVDETSRQQAQQELAARIARAKAKAAQQKAAQQKAAQQEAAQQEAAQQEARS